MFTLRTISANRLVPRNKLTSWVTIASIKNAVLFRFAFNNVAFFTSRTRNANFFYDSFCVAAVREIAARIKFSVSAHFNDHRISTKLTIKSSWFIFNLHFFHLLFSKLANAALRGAEERFQGRDSTVLYGIKFTCA